MSYYSNHIAELHEALLSAAGFADGVSLPAGEFMETWVRRTRQAAETGRHFFFLGNGASATLAEHFGFDALQNAKLKTFNFAETSYLTAISNDISFENVFLPKLERFGEAGDMLISISSSGNSPNVVKALEYAGRHGIFRVTLSAMKPDNQSVRLGDLSLHIPAATYGLAESAHAAVLHCWLDMYMDRYSGGRH
jgi:D-sedoheptulose 7-phosphate isomerase